MSSPLPVNAKQNWSEGADERSSTPRPSSTSPTGEQSLSSSVERNRTTARLSSSPVPPNFASGYGSSPPSITAGDHGFSNTGLDSGGDGLFHRSYGSTTDLQQSFTNHSGTGSIGLFRPMSTPTYNYDDNTVSADMSEDRIAKVVKRHLAGASSPTGSARSASPKRGGGGGNDLSRVDTNNSSSHSNSNKNNTSSNNNNNNGGTYGTVGSTTGSLMTWDNDENGGGSSSLVTNAHQLPGGAITYDIYKWAEDQELEQCKRQRSQSMYIPRQEPADPALARLRDPGGFRRHFVVDKAAREGKEPPHWMTRTFVDFLALYGHFGGEDLSDDEDEDEDEGAIFVEEGSAGLRQRRRRQQEDREEDDGDDETNPLIRKAQANAVQGSATPSKAVFLLLKSFVGTGKT